MNILVHACYINPNKGSEFSVSWNYVMQMSKKHHLYVLVGSTTEDLGNYSALNNISIPNVDFIFLDTGTAFKISNTLYHSVLHYAGAWTRYIAYSFWNKHIYKQIKKNKSLLLKIDVIHFLSPVGWHEIGYLYKLGKPCIWGPVGGFTNCKKEFYSHYVKINGKKIALKNFSNTLSAFASIHIKQAMKKYNLVIANTTDTQSFIKEHYKTQQLVYFPENSMRITESEIKDQAYIEDKYNYLDRKIIECIWCGSLFDGKMPGMLLDIVAHLKNKERIHINIVGGGYMEEYLKERINKEGLDNCITLCGMVHRDIVKEYFKKSYIHLLTSAYEANTTVMFEAMEECVPSIVFNHFGMADLVKDGKTGRKIAIRKYDDMCGDFAACLDEIVRNPSELKKWALNLREDSKQYTSEKRVDFFEKCYSLAIANHKSK